MRLVLSVFAIVVTAAPALAQLDTYICALRPSATNSWVPAQLVIAHDTETGVVTVNDPIIATILGRPVKGEVSDENDKKIAFSWDVKFASDSQGQQAKFRYRAAYIKASQKVTVTATPLGYANNFQARGVCALN